MSLPNIGIKILEQPTGMANAVMTELNTHLLALVKNGTSNSIDLRSLPMNDADRSQLTDLLGKGEVEITLNTIGKSLVHETQYTGIWWLTHYGADDNILSELIEITTIPDIIVSHQDDINIASQKLTEYLIASEKGENENV